jgi:hypothetical protein
MSAPSESFVEALTDEEICPLCLEGYAPVDEVICALCEAPACPGCVEQLDGSIDIDAREQSSAAMRAPARGAQAPARIAEAPARIAEATMRCFACRPALLPPPALPGAERAAQLPPPLPIAARALRPPPLPRRPPEPAFGAQSELDEGGLVVFPAWRKRPLLALARAADAVHLVEVSSLLVGWAHTGGRRFTLGERVSRVSREWSVAVRARGAGLTRYLSLARVRATQLSAPVLSGLRVHGAALSLALKLRALLLVSRTVALSRRVPGAARTAWSHLPAARRSARILTRG